MPYRPKDIYRGRRKYRVPLTIALFVLAFLIIAAVALFYILQQFLVYDQTGVRLQLPFMASETVEEAPPEAEVTPTFEPVEVQVVYEEPDFSDLDLGGWEELAPTKAKFIPYADAANEQKLSAALNAVSGDDYNGVVLELKDRKGQLAWTSDCDMAVAYGTTGFMDYSETVASLHERGMTAAAQISCLADDLLGARNWPVALRTADGAVYTDPDGTCWLDPYNRSVRQYIADLLSELAAMGFDEILLADLYHPVGETVYNDEGEPIGTGFQYSVTVQTTPDPVNAVCQMARRLAEDMGESGVTVSAVIDEASLLAGDGARTGQDLGIFWRIFARLYCPCESWNAMTDLEAAAETLNGGSVGVRFVPVCEYFPEDFDSFLILPTKD